jgi:hypothetical protein
VTAGSEGKQAGVEVELGDGDGTTGVVIELVSLVTLTGRVVEQRTRKPVPKARVDAQVIGGRSSFALGWDPNERGNITDEQGRFTIKRVPLGKVLLTPRAVGYWETFIVRSISGRDVVDVGDVDAIAQHEGSPGDSGIVWAPESDDYTQLDRAQLVVKSVAPGSPAAVAGITAGDIVTHVAGIDMRGYGTVNRYFLLDTAPAGTTFAFTLARGVTVNVTLTKRP